MENTSQPPLLAKVKLKYLGSWTLTDDITVNSTSASASPSECKNMCITSEGFKFWCRIKPAAKGFKKYFNCLREWCISTHLTSPVSEHPHAPVSLSHISYSPLPLHSNVQYSDTISSKGNKMAMKAGQNKRVWTQLHRQCQASIMKPSNKPSRSWVLSVQESVLCLSFL